MQQNDVGQGMTEFRFGAAQFSQWAKGASAVRYLRKLETRLGEAPCLGGEMPTYADIAAGTSMFRWMTMPIEQPSLPNVECW